MDATQDGMESPMRDPPRLLPHRLPRQAPPPPPLPPAPEPRSHRAIAARRAGRGVTRAAHLRVILSVVSMFSVARAAAASYYSNLTLTSLDGDLSVVVYLPDGLKPDERTYYYSSRFEHGSMIGPITYRGHVLFDARAWRQPHNTDWPEAGVGLAAEFGVGDDGAFCYFQCGWRGAEGVTNGVLGYQQAKLGESFLKIGVGELLKGTCPVCDSSEDYRFNSPYLFARPPEWTITGMSDTQVKLEHQALLTDRDHVQYGYRLGKDIQLRGNVLDVTSTLTNLGQQPFSTAWYSHNFFTCDGTAVGPGYEANLYLQGLQGSRLYEEPGTWSWSTPLRQYARLKGRLGSVYLALVRALEPGVRIKADFLDDGQTKGGFLIRACDTQVTSSVHTAEDNVRDLMYAYGLYIERGTFSPEPQILIHLEPGESKSWTQRLLIEKNDGSDIRGGSDGSDGDDGRSSSGNLWRLFQSDDAGSYIASDESKLPQFLFGAAAVMLSAYSIMYLINRFHHHRQLRRWTCYTSIPDVVEGSQS